MSHLCLFCDVYGFSDQILNADLPDLAHRLAEFHTQIHRQIGRRSTEFEIIQFSDSAFLTLCLDPNNPQKDVESFLSVCGEIYETSFENALPIRGCITYGALKKTENSLLGVPVIQSYSIEKDLGVPIIVFPRFAIEHLRKDHPDVTGEFLPDCIDLPFLNGILQATPIFPRAIENIYAVASNQYNKLVGEYYKHKPASAWKDLKAILEPYRLESNSDINREEK